MRTNRHFKFQDLNATQLWQLREEITLNSIYYSDYRNSFEFNEDDICNFFDGYLDYLFELAEEDGMTNPELADVVEAYDTPDNLFDYYWGLPSEYLCSIHYFPEWDSEDELEYENYWNGVDPDGHDPECR